MAHRKLELREEHTLEIWTPDDQGNHYHRHMSRDKPQWCFQYTGTYGHVQTWGEFATAILGSFSNSVELILIHSHGQDNLQAGDWELVLDAINQLDKEYLDNGGIHLDVFFRLPTRTQR